MCFLDEYPGYLSSTVLKYMWCESWRRNDIAKLNPKLAQGLDAASVGDGCEARRELQRRGWDEARFAQARTFCLKRQRVKSRSAACSQTHKTDAIIASVAACSQTT